MFDINKITVVANEAVLYDGDQIAVLFNGQAELSMTDEDMENGELPKDKQKEIRTNKETIVEEIKRLGYSIVE